jgi:hypothetical protein
MGAAGTAGLPADVLDYLMLVSGGINPRLLSIPVAADAELAELRMPVRLAAGGRDVMLNSRASAGRLRRLVPRAEIDLLPDAGHIVTGEGPRLAAFLGAAWSAGAAETAGD